MPEKPKPFYALTEKDRKIYSVFANMSDDEFREAQAVVAGIPAPGTGPFAKTAAAFVAACSTPEFRTSMAAHQILEAASAARGDGAELSSRLSGPDQTPGPTATAGGIVRAGKQRRGEV